MAANPNFDLLGSVALNKHRKTLVDQVFGAMPLLATLRAKGSVNEKGGLKIVQPLLYGENSTFDWLSKYGIIDTTAQEGISAAEFPWCHLAGSIVVSNIEIDIENAGEEQVIDLLDAKVKQATLSAQDKIYDQLWSSRDHVLKMWGLPDIVRSSDPANVATVGNFGNIDRDTYTWWKSQVYDATQTALSIDMVNHIYNLCADGTDVPDIGVCGIELYEKFESLLMTNMRYQDEKLANSGIEHLKHKNMVVVLDKGTDTVGCDAAGSGDRKFYCLNSKYIELVNARGRTFQPSEFMRVPNQDVRVAQILYSGQLTAKNCKRQGYITDARKS